MDRQRAIVVFACGCMLLLRAGNALAEPNAVVANAELSPPAPIAEPGSGAANADTKGPAKTTEPGSIAIGAISNSLAATAATDDCLTSEKCIDLYLWSLYERTPKVDALRVYEKRRVTVHRKGKARTVVRTVTKYVDQDFAWKDFRAADKIGLSPLDYVIGGMDRAFKRTMYRAFRAMDDAGLEPGITSAFRDDYRQAIASGNKARSDRSFHGGSTRGGYGHGLAVDLVSVKGETRAERYRSSEVLWKWIDAHGRELGIGRPYLDRDAPHVGPVDGKEYIARRGGTTFRLAAANARPHRHAGRRIPKAEASQIRARRAAASAKSRARPST